MDMPNAQQGLPPGALLQNGKYAITQLLGQGGFGITYLAKHLVFGDVAIKELFLNSSPTQCSRDTISGRLVIPHFDRAAFETFKQRFLSEARTLYNLRNIKGVVKVLDIFEENDTVYFAMEYLHGEKLEEYVAKRHPVAIAEGKWIINAVGEALAAVHRLNLLHCDVKPSIFIVDSTGEVTLIDFGIARDYELNSDSSTHTTFHSPRYSPSEQRVAKARMGPYSDVYSLGAVAYFVFTGQAPQSLEERLTDGFLRRAS